MQRDGHADQHEVRQEVGQRRRAAPCGRSAPEGTSGWSGAGCIPVRARARPAAAMLRVVWAALNAHRCGALRWARPTTREDVARSSTATGKPQYSSAAKLNVTEATGDSAAVRCPAATIGRISPTTTSAAMTQNRGWRTSSASPDRCASAQAKTARPATVTAVMWIHSGEPTRRAYVPGVVRVLHEPSSSVAIDCAAVLPCHQKRTAKIVLPEANCILSVTTCQAVVIQLRFTYELELTPQPRARWRSPVPPQAPGPAARPGRPRPARGRRA